MKTYDYLIFDLDNTLLNFSKSEYHALKALFTKYGIVFNDQSFSEYEVINKSLWHQLEEGKISKKTVLETRFSTFFGTKGIRVDGKQVDQEYRELLEGRHDVIEGALDVLKVAKEQGYTVFAGTNGVGQTQRVRLNTAKMTDYFDALYISEEIGFEKPDVRFFDSIFAEQRIIDTSRVLMIGDSLTSDIRGANRVGIDSVWFNVDGEINDIEPSTYEVSNLQGLKELLIK